MLSVPTTWCCYFIRELLDVCDVLVGRQSSDRGNDKSQGDEDGGQRVAELGSQRHATA